MTMNRSQSGGLALLLLATTLLAACTTDEPFPSLDVEVTASLLPALSPSEGRYVLWMSYPDDPTAEKRSATTHSSGDFVLIGEFVVDDNGDLKALNGDDLDLMLPDGYNPQLIFDAILTVEPTGPLPEEPTSRLLSGPVEGTEKQGRASLTVNGEDAFDGAFSNGGALGEAKYGLITPSTVETDDENRGVWFFGLGSAPGLPLDSLSRLRENRGWAYEAWVEEIATGQRYSLGHFFSPDQADSDGAGTFSGAEKEPLAIPGSDFVNGTVLDLNNGEYGLEVSLQPVDLLLDRPFFQLYRRDTIPQDVQTGVPLVLPYTRTEPVISVTFSR